MRKRKNNQRAEGKRKQTDNLRMLLMNNND
jgi:hypothetical protein